MARDRSFFSPRSLKSYCQLFLFFPLYAHRTNEAIKTNHFKIHKGVAHPNFRTNDFWIFWIELPYNVHLPRVEEKTNFPIQSRVGRWQDRTLNSWHTSFTVAITSPRARKDRRGRVAGRNDERAGCRVICSSMESCALFAARGAISRVGWPLSRELFLRATPLLPVATPRRNWKVTKRRAKNLHDNSLPLWFTASPLRGERSHAGKQRRLG